MTVKLLIARHGNTFAPGETPRRVGARTDLPLVGSGQEQAKRLGAYLKNNDLQPDIVYTSRLKRTIETAQGALAELGLSRPIHQSDLFDEIDYGPDENLTDADVIARIGADAIAAWDQDAIMPQGWSPAPDLLQKRWADFAAHCEKTADGKTILVVTSNGIARFAPALTGAAASLRDRKMSTGALSILEGGNGNWTIRAWNLKP